MKRVLFIIAACVLGLALPAFAANVSIDITRSGYSPQTESINTGDTVIWTNRDSRPHTVTGSGFGATVQPGTSTSHKFTSAGSYPYRCTIHGETGVINVGGATSRPPSPPPPPPPPPSPSPSPRPSPTRSPSPLPSPPPPPPPLSPSPVVESPLPSPSPSEPVRVSPSPAGPDEPSAPVAQDVGEKGKGGVPGVLAVAIVGGVVAGISGLGLWYLRRSG